MFVARVTKEALHVMYFAEPLWEIRASTSISIAPRTPKYPGRKVIKGKKTERYAGHKFL